MRFSIIVPAYNVASYIEDALRSVLGQSYEDWECLCIDDGSKDGTAEILDAFSAMDNRFRIIHKQNQGVAAARNDGLKMAQGEWIAYLDGDDLWDCQFLRLAVEMMNKHPRVDMVVFGQSLFDDVTKDCQTRPLVKDSVCVIEDSCVPSQLFQVGFFQAVYRRSTLGGARFPPLCMGEDRVYIFRCLKNAKVIVEHPLVAYHYRLRKMSAVHSSQSLIKRYHMFCASCHIMLLSLRIRMCWRDHLRYVCAVKRSLFELVGWY